MLHSCFVEIVGTWKIGVSKPSLGLVGEFIDTVKWYHWNVIPPVKLHHGKE